MKRMKPLSLLFALGWMLAACSSANPTISPALSQPAEPSRSAEQPTVPDLTRSDDQGAITVEVKPDNLSDPDEALLFTISMTTHSVDLSMDLASLADLSTDSGQAVQATLWDAPRGGHHVSGTLSFPANVNGKPILEGATQLTLTIKTLDVPERVFTWDLP